MIIVVMRVRVVGIPAIPFRLLLIFVRILMTKCQDNVRILASDKTAGNLRQNLRQ